MLLGFLVSDEADLDDFSKYVVCKKSYMNPFFFS